jgi:hypothetical protein
MWIFVLPHKYSRQCFQCRVITMFQTYAKVRNYDVMIRQSSLGLYPDISQKYNMGDICKGMANTL